MIKRKIPAKFFFLFSAYTVIALFVVFIGYFLFYRDVKDTQASGEVSVTVRDELGNNLSGATVTAVCPGGSYTSAFTDAGSGVYTKPVFAFSGGANCQDGESLTFNISKTGYITRMTSGTYTYSSTASPNSYTLTWSDQVKFGLKVVVKEELGNGTTLDTACTSGSNCIKYIVSGISYYADASSWNEYYFARTGTTGTLIVNKPGFVDATSTNTGLSSVGTMSSTQTVVNLGCLSGCSNGSSSVTSGTTVNLTGLKYALKSQTLKSELYGSITGIQNSAGIIYAGNPSMDATVSVSGGTTVYASAVKDDVVYLAVTGDGGANDAITIQLQNVTADGGAANGANFVAMSITDTTNLISRTNQRTFSIGASDADIYQYSGFRYPLRAVVANNTGTAINIANLSSITYNGVAPYAISSNTAYFGNIGTNSTLAISMTGYDNAQTTNPGLLSVTTGQSAETIIIFGTYSAASVINSYSYNQALGLTPSSGGGGGGGGGAPTIVAQGAQMPLTSSATTSNSITVIYPAASTYTSLDHYVILYKEGTYTLSELVAANPYLIKPNSPNTGDNADLLPANYTQGSTKVISGLLPLTSYTFAIVGANASETEISGMYVLTTMTTSDGGGGGGGPNIISSGAPGIFSINSKTETSITLNYGAPATYTGFVQYVVVYDVDTDGTKTFADMVSSSTTKQFITLNARPELGYIDYTVPGSSPTSSIMIWGLNPGQQYAFAIAAVNSANLDNVTEVAVAGVFRATTDTPPPVTVNVSMIMTPTADQKLIDAKIDPMGRAHVLMEVPTDLTHRSIIYKMYDLNGWSNEYTFVNYEVNGGIEYSASLALNTSGYPGVAWAAENYTTGPVTIHYQYLENGSWTNDVTIDTIELNYSGQVALVYNTTGFPVIAATWGNHMYRYVNNAFEISQPLQEGGSSTAFLNNISMAIDYSNHLHIATYNNDKIRYFNFDGTNWSMEEPVTNIGGVFEGPYADIQIALDMMSNPRIAYHKYLSDGNDAIYFVQKNGTWGVPVLVSSNDAESQHDSSIGLTSRNGIDLISYIDGVGGKVRYAYSQDGFTTKTSEYLATATVGQQGSAIAVYDVMNMRFDVFYSYMLTGQDQQTTVPEFSMYLYACTFLIGCWMLRKHLVV